MKRLVRGEKGYVLIAALLVLLVLGLISGPVLSYMVSGLRAGHIFETGAAELYAADAGVEDAVWRIPNAGLCVGQSTNYPISDVNGKSVDVTVTLTNNVTGILTYKITSIAVTDGGGNTADLGSSTQIEAYISGTPTYISLLDHLVTVQEDLDDKEIAALENDLAKLGIDCPTSCTECDKCLKAYDYDSDAYRDVPKECKGCIAVYNLPSTAWPTVSNLSDRYWEQVKNGISYNSTIDLNGQNMTLQTGYRNGTLQILNGSKKNAATLTLNGTFYIRDYTEIGMDGGGSNKPNLTIELKGQTIFVACNYTKDDGYALKIGPWCTINGPGAIIAVGDIYFQPNGGVGTNAEPALILSVAGTTMIQPNIDFLGAIGGKIDVNVQSGHANVDYPAGGFDEINFPSLFEAYLDYSIASWEVSRQ